MLSNDGHVSNVCKRASHKLNANTTLSRVANYMIIIQLMLVKKT